MTVPKASLNKFNQAACGPETDDDEARFDERVKHTPVEKSE